MSIKSSTDIISSSEEILTKNYEMINIFNQHFKCNKVQNILNLYNKKSNIWQHPLILNYDYCLFCLEKSKNKYSIHSLKENHIKMNNKELINFFHKNSILFRQCKSKIDKLKYRKFIKSSEKKRKKKFKNENETLSDTELFIINKEKIKKNKKPSTRFLNSKSQIIFSGKNDSMNLNEENNNNNLNNGDNNNNEDSIREMKNIIIDEQSENNSNIFNENSLINQPKKNKLKVNVKANLDNNENINLKKKVSKSPLNNSKILKNGFNFFSSFFKKFSSNDSPNNSITEIPFPDFERREIKETNKSEENNKKYSIKNEICSICMGEIKDKFVLGCGDFYCRECIRNIILNSLNDISKFDKMICPTCNEQIEENFIKKLCTEKEYKKYNKYKKRIEGLKNKELIPCPYPDCESYSNINLVSKNITKCENNHIFCVKCLKIIIDEKYKEDHICVDEKKDLNYRYLLSEKTIRKCPNCNSWVQRDEKILCNNMTCSNIWCNYEFCWICGNQYDKSHYKNPLSICFGLQESKFESKFAKYKSIRVLKCLLIFILLICIVFPIIIVLFSFIVVGIYFVTVILVGTNFKKLKLKNQILKKIFYIFVYLNYTVLALSLLSFGYLCFGILVIEIPILFIYKKMRKGKFKMNIYNLLIFKWFFIN